jgi:DNA-binding HxlR family transcriptional regulator
VWSSPALQHDVLNTPGSNMMTDGQSCVPGPDDDRLGFGHEPLGANSFSEIRRGVPGISRTLLVDRLRRLERYGVIDRRRGSAGRGHIYILTEAGLALGLVCDALGVWGEHWIESCPSTSTPTSFFPASSNVLRLSTFRSAAR